MLAIEAPSPPVPAASRPRRVAVPQDLVVRFPHPFSPRLHLQRRVRDVGAGGLSFWTDPLRDLAIHPGAILDPLELHRDGQLLGRLRVEVRHVTHREREHCGVQVLPDARADWKEALALALQRQPLPPRP